MGSLVKEYLAVRFDLLQDPRLDQRKKYLVCMKLFFWLGNVVL